MLRVWSFKNHRDVFGHVVKAKREKVKNRTIRFHVYTFLNIKLNDVVRPQNRMLMRPTKSACNREYCFSGSLIFGSQKRFPYWTRKNVFILRGQGMKKVSLALFSSFPVSRAQKIICRSSSNRYHDCRAAGMELFFYWSGKRRWRRIKPQRNQ